MGKRTIKADLHVHSCYSTRPSQWILRKVGAAESYTDPLHLVRIAHARGMDLVTITDHNTLAGSLEIAHLPGAFVSEEITTYFPEDRCKLHVLAYDITERHHEEISHLRGNVHDLVAYLNREGIVHVLAHPMYPINDRLTTEHFEQALLLFNNFEINGARNSEQNRILSGVLASLTPADIHRLADKHDLIPYGEEPWRKNLTGGSDDHASVNIATTHTEMEGVHSPREFLAGIGQGNARVRTAAYTPKDMAHTIYSVTYQFYKQRFLEGRKGSTDHLLLRFADHALIPALHGEESIMERVRGLVTFRKNGTFFQARPDNMQALLLHEAREIIYGDPGMRELVKRANADPRKMAEVWYRFVNRISERVFKQFADNFLESVSGANLFDIFHTVGSVGSLYTLLVPYFVSYTLFTKDRRFCAICRHGFSDGNGDPPRRPEMYMAHFTDTYDDVNGVARTLQMQLRVALENKKHLEIITCGRPSRQKGAVNFEPIGTFEMPEYPGMKLDYPPLLRMLHHCYEQGVTHIHAATPGPIGLAALAIARILNLPVYGTYHTALPDYVTRLTEDPTLGDLMWRYMVWFYNGMDIVYVPSHETGRDLVSRGIREDKIRFYPRGIDIERFHPSKANGFFRGRYRLFEPEIKLIYAGRVSKEKNLPFLAEVFREVHRLRKGVRLVVVGDGPYLRPMQETLSDLPVTFTGFLDGDDLPEAYASSDVFVFPSTTDTFGNVVLEAQACGLPVVVTDRGGPQENIVPDETGFVVPADDHDAFLQAVLRLVDDAPLRERMGKRARDAMRSRSFEAAYLQLWQRYGDDAPGEKVRHAG